MINDTQGFGWVWSEDELDAQLHRSHRSKDGLDFIPADEPWKLTERSRNKCIFGNSLKAFEPSVYPYFKLALARYAEHAAADSVAKIPNYINLLVRSYPDLDDILDPVQFISLKKKRGSQREYQVSTIRGFLRFWHKCGIPGVSDEFIAAVEGLTYQGNEKGRAVITEDVHEGPLTPIERDAFYAGLKNAYATDRIDIKTYVVGLLYVELGQRSAQYQQLRFGDFSDDQTVNMPRAKQQKTSFRGTFSRMPISDSLSEAINHFKRRVIAEIGEENQIDEVPIVRASRQGRDEFDRGTAHFQHAPVEAWRDLIALIEASIDTKSERTGKPLVLTARRFRRTLGSDLAREGAGVGVIAKALDHEDNQNAGVYVSTSPEIAQRLDRKLAKRLAPLAQAFSGAVIRSEEEATRAGDPSSRLRTRDGSTFIGSCGETGFCGESAPVACYTCVRFQPWRDAPHEEVAQQLYEEREQLIAETGDLTIASILDRSILAVEEVIDLCEVLKRQETSDE